VAGASADTAMIALKNLFRLFMVAPLWMFFL
jgi:hypothetical protein